MGKLMLSEVDKRIWEKYGNRVVRVGSYWSRQLTVLCHCHKCNGTFRQKAESLFRGYTTRCRCNYDKPAPSPDRSGHRVLNPWDISENIVIPCERAVDESRFRGLE